MAEGDNPARFTNTGNVQTTVGGGTAKANPISKNRLPEDTARSNFYAGAGQKDVLPEHTARRTTYPIIFAD